MSTASAAGADRVDTQQIAPSLSLLKYSLAFVLVVIATADANRVADPDLWGHLLFGQLILSHRHLTYHDLYSYSAPGSVWINHEWLSEVLMALSYSWAGVIGLKALKFTCVGAIVLFSAIAIGETGASPGIQQIIVAAEAVALRGQLQCRPELSSLVLISWLLLLVTRDTHRGSARLWLAIPVFVIWSNLHGGFMVGLSVLWVYAGVTAVQDTIARHRISRAIKLGCIATAASFATLVNPYGLRLWANVWHTLSNSLIRQMVDEWRPLTAVLVQCKGDPYVLMICGPTLLLMLSLAICVTLQPDNHDLALIAMSAVLSVSAFSAARNLRLATIAVCVPLAFHAELVRASGFRNSWRDLLETLNNVRNRSPAGTRASTRIPTVLPGSQGWVTNAAIDQRSGTNQLLVAAVAIALAACTGLFSSELKVAPGTSYPVGAVRFLEKNGLHGNLLCDYNWAGYVLWHASPSKVFIDGRCETVYSANIIRDYIRFRFGLPGGARILEDYPHDYVLVPISSRAYSVTIKDPNWKLLYHDPQAAVFGRAIFKSGELSSPQLRGSVLQSRFP